jgi:hypothetical protein
MNEPREKRPHRQPSAQDVRPGGGYQLPHGLGDSLVALDGRAGAQLRLERTGPQSFEWSPHDRQALDLELRARIVATTATLGTTPLVRWRLEIGHGTETWSLPVGPIPLISGTRHEDPILPGRGLLLRVSARRLKITFVGGFDLDDGIVESSTIEVSVQPSAADKCCNADAYQQYGDPTALPPPPHVQPFPMGAREFMIRDPFTSAAFGLGGCVVIFTSIAGDLFGPLDVFTAGFGEWTPIPVHAIGLLSSVPIGVSYR